MGAFGNLGGASAALLQVFPELAGWRVTTAGLVIPRRRIAVSTQNYVVPNAGDLGVQHPCNLGQGPVGTGAPIQLAPNQGILIENSGVTLRNQTNDLKTTSVASVCLTFAVSTAPDTFTAPPLILLQVMPPTLNITRPFTPATAYQLSQPYAVHFDDLKDTIVMSGGAFPAVPTPIELYWSVILDNSGAVANTITLSALTHFRIFEGVTTA